MAPGRSTEIISMIKWIRTSRLSVKKSLSLGVGVWIVNVDSVLGLSIIFTSISTTDSRKTHDGFYPDDFVDPFAFNTRAVALSGARARERFQYLRREYAKGCDICDASTQKVALSGTRVREQLRYSGHERAKDCDI